MLFFRTKGDANSLSRFELLKSDLANTLFKDETFWKERANSFWLKDGYINSKCFHATAMTKKEADKIKKLRDDNGSVFTDHANLCRIVRNYFSHIF